MALKEDELWTIDGKSGTVHILFDECLQDVNALQRKGSSGGWKSASTASSNPSCGSSDIVITAPGKTKQPSEGPHVPTRQTNQWQGLLNTIPTDSSSNNLIFLKKVLS